MSIVLGSTSAGNNKVSSISTISMSPDWISAAPSHDMVIGMQSPSTEQFSGVCNEKSNKKTDILSVSVWKIEELKSFAIIFVLISGHSQREFVLLLLLAGRNVVVDVVCALGAQCEPLEVKGGQQKLNVARHYALQPHLR